MYVYIMCATSVTLYEVIQVMHPHIVVHLRSEQLPIVKDDSGNKVTCYASNFFLGPSFIRDSIVSTPCTWGLRQHAKPRLTAITSGIRFTPQLATSNRGKLATQSPNKHPSHNPAVPQCGIICLSNHFDVFTELYLGNKTQEHASKLRTCGDNHRKFF